MEVYRFLNIMAENKILRLTGLMENTGHRRRNSNNEYPASLVHHLVRRSFIEDGSFSDGGSIQL